MKKILWLFIVLVVLVPSTISKNVVYAANLSDNVVIQLTETHTDNQIDIKAKLVTNTGISGMTLELVFNRDIFEYVGYDAGTALSSLDLITTDTSESSSLPIKFNWLFQNRINDTSVGSFLTVHLRLKDDAKSGKYEVKFKHESGDICYIDGDGISHAKKAIISKAVVNISDNKISQAKIYEENQKIDTSTLILILGISAISFSATVATIIIIRIKRTKRKKKDWLEI